MSGNKSRCGRVTRFDWAFQADAELEGYDRFSPPVLLA